MYTTEQSDTAIKIREAMATPPAVGRNASGANPELDAAILTAAEAAKISKTELQCAQFYRGDHVADE
jgi:hypothetical protein